MLIPSYMFFFLCRLIDAQYSLVERLFTECNIRSIEVRSNVLKTFSGTVILFCTVLAEIYLISRNKSSTSIYSANYYWPEFS